MKIGRIRKLKCGYSIKIDAEDEEIKLLLLEGIRRFVKESGIKCQVSSLEDEKYKESKDIKTHDLSEDEEQYLLNLGFCSALCNQLDFPFPKLETFDKLSRTRKISKVK